jgi:hypothetical protein
MTAPSRSCARLGGAALSALAALTLAACGGSSTTTGGPAPTSPAAAVASADVQRTAGSADASAHAGARDTVSREGAVQRPLRDTGGAEVNDENVGKPDDQSTSAGAVAAPCKLVSQAQAQAIVGAPIAAPQTAPLGPTCIYQPQGGGEQVTLTVEALNFAKIRAKIHGLTRTAIVGHTAYCGRYGRTTTFVPLAHHQVLNVAAPCALGIRFAAIATRQLESR